MGKQKVHQPGYVLFSQCACIETWVCPLPCDRVVLFPCPFISWHLRGYPQGGHQSMSMSVVMLPYCALEMYPSRGWAALTPHNNWITYFHSLLTYLFAHWWPRYGPAKAPGPSTMNELGCYMYAHFTSMNLVLQNHTLGEKNYMKKSSNQMKENIIFAFSYVFRQGSFAAREKTRM